jgi:CTP synthase
MHLKSPGDVLFVMVSYLPIPSTIGEMKTRPTQHAVQQLNSYGIQPDIIIARAAKPLDQKRKEKLAIWCNVQPDHIISAPDVDSIYDVPVNFERDELSSILLKALGKHDTAKSDMREWEVFARMHTTARKK